MCIQNSDLQLKLTRYRNQSVREIDAGLKEKSEKWTKEKRALMDEKKQLQAELDKVKGERGEEREGRGGIGGRSYSGSSPCIIETSLFLHM